MSRERIINIPKNNSSDSVWITWYDALKTKFGRKKANSLFTANWDAQDGSNSDANTTTLRQHLEKEGKLDIKGSFAGEIKDKAFDVANFFWRLYYSWKIFRTWIRCYFSWWSRIIYI